MPMKPSLASEVVFTWFGMSIFIHVMSGAILCLWLRFHGVALQSFYLGFPGYLERRYREWSTSRGHFNRWVVDLRFLSLANMVVSAAIAIPMMTSTPYPG
jgi:hypothetical protein